MGLDFFNLLCFSLVSFECFLFKDLIKDLIKKNKINLIVVVDIYEIKQQWHL